MPLIGVPLAVYTEKLSKIPKGILPTRTIERFDERLKPFSDEMKRRALRYDCEFDPAVHCNDLPLEFYATCSFEELAKIWFTHFIMLPREINEYFEKAPKYRIIDKIRSSLWRCGYADAKNEWNTLVDAYNGIKNFSFGLPEFEVCLNYTVGNGAFSHTEFDDRYLDGVFGFIVHYKSEPVMTISFSFAKGKRLLISQIQLRNKKGNRFLYKLPMGRTEYVVKLMKQYFPTFHVYLVNGSLLVERYVKEIEMGIERELASSSPDAKHIACIRKKIEEYNGEVGVQIRRTYCLSEGEWKTSPYFSIKMHHRKFMHIVRS